MLPPQKKAGSLADFLLQVQGYLAGSNLAILQFQIKIYRQHNFNKFFTGKLPACFDVHPALNQVVHPSITLGLDP